MKKIVFMFHFIIISYNLAPQVLPVITWRFFALSSFVYDPLID